MTIDEGIELLHRAKKELGGGATLWVRTDYVSNKWDEQMADRIVPVDDGESRYVRIETITHPMCQDK